MVEYGGWAGFCMGFESLGASQVVGLRVQFLPNSCCGRTVRSGVGVGGGVGVGSSLEIPRRLSQGQCAQRDILSSPPCSRTHRLPWPLIPSSLNPGSSLARLNQLSFKVGVALPRGGLPRGNSLRRGLATPSASVAGRQPMALVGGKAGWFKWRAGLPRSFPCQPWAGQASSVC